MRRTKTRRDGTLVEGCMGALKQKREAVASVWHKTRCDMYCTPEERMRAAYSPPRFACASRDTALSSLTDV